MTETASHYSMHDALQRKIADRWTCNGKLHNADGICNATYNPATGILLSTECRLRGVLHAISPFLPSRATYFASGSIACEQWHVAGALSNFPFAAEIRYDEHGEWIEQKHYRNGKLSRLLGAAHIKRVRDILTGEYRLSFFECYAAGVPSSCHGPQRLRCTVSDGVIRKTFRNCFNGVPFTDRYHILCSALLDVKQHAPCEQQYSVLPPADGAAFDRECVVCMKAFSPRLFAAADTLATGAGALLQCGACRHAFHLRCVERWDASCAAAATPLSCPVCRARTGKYPLRLTDAAQRTR
jgi:hypothetical protein